MKSSKEINQIMKRKNVRHSWQSPNNYNLLESNNENANKYILHPLEVIREIPCEIHSSSHHNHENFSIQSNPFRMLLFFILGSQGKSYYIKEI